MSENLKPKRSDVLQDKFLGMESWAHKAGRFICDESEMKKCVRMMKGIMRDLDVLVNTSEEAGKKIGWWE